MSGVGGVALTAMPITLMSGGSVHLGTDQLYSTRLLMLNTYDVYFDIVKLRSNANPENEKTGC